MKMKFLLSLGILAMALACGEAPEPRYQLSSYEIDPRSSLPSRITVAPALVLAYMNDLDETQYKSYIPTSAEKSRIASDFVKLPPLHKKILKDRLIGIYFFDDLMGSGYTDWVRDENGDYYAWMVFHTDVLKKSISQLVTEKELTAYKNDPGLEINCGKASGFLYILLHETTHALDYALSLSPYVEEAVKKGNPGPRDSEFTRGIWTSLKSPLGKYNFSLRSNIKFYGFGGGPKLEASDASLIYDELVKTPFVSLYGTASWAEDLAEALTFYHLTRKMKLPYEIKVRGKTWTPASSPNFQARAKSLERFYEDK